MPEHLDEAIALLWIEGELDAAASAHWREHAGACHGCRRLSQALRQETLWLRQSLGAASAPARASHWALWAALAGIGSAVLGVFAFWALMLRPWMQGLNQMGFNGQNLMNTLMFSAMFWRGWASLNHLLEILVPVTFCASAWLLLRPQRSRWGKLASAILLLGVLAAAPSSRLWAAPKPKPIAHAIPARQIVHLPEYIHSSTPFTLPAGQAVAHDLVIWAPQVRIDGQVRGNLVIWAQAATIDGQIMGDVAAWTQSLYLNRDSQIHGDVISFSQNIHASGSLDGTVYAWAQTDSIAGKIGGSVFAWDQSLHLEPQASVARDIISANQFFDLQGTVSHNVLAAFQANNIGGQVHGVARLYGKHLNIGPTAKLERSVYFKGPQPPQVSPQAQLARSVKFTRSDHISAWRKASFYWHQALWWAAGMLFGLVFLALFPDFFASAERLTARVGLSLGVGIVALVATPILAVLAAITIIGLPLSLVLLFLYLIGLFFAEILVAKWLGAALLGAANQYWQQALRLALGLLIVRIAVNLPWAGGWIWFAILIWGLGLQAVALFQRLHRPAAPA